MGSLIHFISYLLLPGSVIVLDLLQALHICCFNPASLNNNQQACNYGLTLS